MRGLFIVFIVVPIIEMFILIKVGERIGAWPTIALVLVTAIIGVNLLRQQGLATLQKANWRMEHGQMPAQEMLEGIILAIGGVLLLTPGFFTDFIGFICLLAPLRKIMIQRLLKNSIVVSSAAHQQRSQSEVFRDRQGHQVIDGEFRRDDDPENR